MSKETWVFVRVLLILANCIALVAFICLALWGDEGALSVPDRILCAAGCLAVLLMLLGAHYEQSNN